MGPATVLLTIAALGGIVMAVLRFRGADRPPSWLAMLHGLLAAAALTLLINAALTVGLPKMALLATAFLLVAAVGGAYLNLQFHAKNLALPIPVVLIHAGVAVTGFVLLLFAQLQGPATG